MLAGNHIITKLSLAMLLLASVARPDQRADRDAFSDAILSMDKDIADAKRNFTKILEPFQDGKPGDRADLTKPMTASPVRSRPRFRTRPR